MPVFMVERYIPNLDADGVEAHARKEQALANGAGNSSELRHLRTTYSREDELCFSLFEAPSREELVTANDRSGLPYERVVEVIDAGAMGAEG